jgi:hypothetical protein
VADSCVVADIPAGRCVVCVGTLSILAACLLLPLLLMLPDKQALTAVNADQQRGGL